MLLGSLGVFVNCVARSLENGAGIGDCVISIVSSFAFVTYSWQGKCNQPRVIEIERSARWEINVFGLGGVLWRASLAPMMGRLILRQLNVSGGSKLRAGNSDQ